MRPRNHAHAALLSWSSGRLRPAGGSWSRAACPGPARSGLGADGSAEPAPAADARKLTKLTGLGLEHFHIVSFDRSRGKALGFLREGANGRAMLQTTPPPDPDALTLLAHAPPR